MTAAEAALQIRMAAGRRARDEALMLDRLVETLRLASFRSYLLATVDSMSALVPAVLEMVGSDVPTALQRVRPSHLWPGSTETGSQRARPESPDRPAKTRSGSAPRPAKLIGDAVIADGALGDWLEARIAGRSLDISLRSDCYEFSTRDGTGYILFVGLLPDTVVAAAEGRALTDVVDHPLFRSRGFVVDRAAQVGNRTSLTFDVGRMAVEMPWRE